MNTKLRLGAFSSRSREHARYTTSINVCGDDAGACFIHGCYVSNIKRILRACHTGSPAAKVVPAATSSSDITSHSLIVTELACRLPGSRHALPVSTATWHAPTGLNGQPVPGVAEGTAGDSDRKPGSTQLGGFIVPPEFSSLHVFVQGFVISIVLL